MHLKLPLAFAFFFSMQAHAAGDPDLSLLAKDVPKDQLKMSPEILKNLSTTQEALNAAWNTCLPMIKKEMVIEALRDAAPQKKKGSGDEASFESTLRMDSGTGEPFNFSKTSGEYVAHSITRIQPASPMIDDVSGPRSESLKFIFIVTGDVVPRGGGEPLPVTGTVYLNEGAASCYGDYKSIDPRKKIMFAPDAEMQVQKLLQLLSKRGLRNPSAQLDAWMARSPTADEWISALTTEFKLSHVEALNYLPALRTTVLSLNAQKSQAAPSAVKPPVTSQGRQ